MRIIVITTDVEQSGKLEAELAPAGKKRIELSFAVGMEDARETLGSCEFDLIVFDMAKGVDDTAALASVINRCIGTPLVILVAEKDEELAQKALGMGADQYCRREWLLHDFLLCMGQFLSLRSRKLPPRSNDASVRRRMEKDLQQSIEKLSQLKPSAADEQRKKDSIMESQPDFFNRLVRRFSDLLELALERAMFKVDHNISSTLEHLAQEIGELGATPRDIVEVYSAALQFKKKRSNEARYNAYAEEGRLMVLEVMGHLVHYYRRVALVDSNGQDGWQTQE